MTQLPNRPIILKRGTGKRGKKTPNEQAYIKRAVEFGCLLTHLKTGIAGTPAEFNHIRTHVGTSCLAKHSEGFALSPELHRLGDKSLSALGRKGWEKYHGFTELQLVQISQEMFGWKR